MKARAWTDGNPDDVRERTFQVVMDADLIRLAGSQDEAVSCFCETASYIGEVQSFGWFEINKFRYVWDHAKRGWKTTRA